MYSIRVNHCPGPTTPIKLRRSEASTHPIHLAIPHSPSPSDLTSLPISPLPFPSHPSANQAILRPPQVFNQPNHPPKNPPKLSLGGPTPRGGRAAERQFPPSPRPDQSREPPSPQGFRLRVLPPPHPASPPSRPFLTKVPLPLRSHSAPSPPPSRDLRKTPPRPLSRVGSSPSPGDLCKTRPNLANAAALNPSLWERVRVRVPGNQVGLPKVSLLGERQIRASSVRGEGLPRYQPPIPPNPGLSAPPPAPTSAPSSSLALEGERWLPAKPPTPNSQHPTTPHLPLPPSPAR